MPDHFSKKVAEILRIIERREHEKLQDASLDVPLKFNWIRDVFTHELTHIITLKSAHLGWPF